MKTFKWTLSAVLFISITQIISCTKNVDTTPADAISAQVSDNLSFPVTNEFANCKLRRITHREDANDPFSRIDNGLFTYNAAGNPYSFTYDFGTNSRNSYFFYDNKNRLIEWKQSYHRDDYSESTVHKYGYDANNVIIVDTLFLYANSSDDGSLSWGDTIVIGLTYDSQGRVVKEAIRNVKGGATSYPTYTYDSRGNLAIPGWKSSSYDYKVSIFRAHPIFQFIHRNYSRNNGGVQPKYNSKGLPLSGRPLNDQFFNAYPTSFGNELGIIKAIYDCQ